MVVATVYLDGAFLEEDQARIPATDPALAWGVGVFEVARAYNGRAFQLPAHLARLRRSAEYFGLPAEVPDLDPVVQELLRRNHLGGGYTRITLTGGGHLIVVAQAWTPPAPELYLEGAALSLAPFRRDSGAPLSGHKTLNYLENMRTRWEAEEHGVLDALVLDFDDRVLEGTRCNIFAVEGSRLISPPLSQGILPGVTRGVVIDLARRNGLEVEELSLGLERLLGADESFVTSTMMEVVPVVRIGEAVLPGPGPVALSMARAYKEKVIEECGC